MPSSACKKPVDRKSTRLNSSHLVISYAVFCLKKHFHSDEPWLTNYQCRAQPALDREAPLLKKGELRQSQLCVPLECFFFNDTATTEIYTLSLHDALPISIKPTVRASANMPVNIDTGTPSAF